MDLEVPGLPVARLVARPPDLAAGAPSAAGAHTVWGRVRSTGSRRVGASAPESYPNRHGHRLARSPPLRALARHPSVDLGRHQSASQTDSAADAGAAVIACGKGRSSNERGGQIVQNHGACDACGLWYSRYRRRAARLPPLLPSCWSLAAGSGGVGHATWAFSARARECVRSNALMIRLKRRSGGSGGLTSTHDPAAPVPSGPRLGAQLGGHSEGVS